MLICMLTLERQQILMAWLKMIKIHHTICTCKCLFLPADGKRDAFQKSASHFFSETVDKCAENEESLFHVTYKCYTISFIKTSYSQISLKFVTILLLVSMHAFWCSKCEQIDVCSGPFCNNKSIQLRQRPHAYNLTSDLETIGGYYEHVFTHKIRISPEALTSSLFSLTFKTDDASHAQFFREPEYH